MFRLVLLNSADTGLNFPSDSSNDAGRVWHGIRLGSGQKRQVWTVAGSSGHQKWRSWQNDIWVPGKVTHGCLECWLTKWSWRWDCERSCQAAVTILETGWRVVDIQWLPSPWWGPFAPALMQWHSHRRLLTPVGLPSNHVTGERQSPLRW